MTATLAALPPRRSDLLVRPFGDIGEAVVKDPRTGEYFNLGQEESFLLDCLDGDATIDGVKEKYRQRFGTEITEDDLRSFVELAQSLGFLREAEPGPEAPVEPRPKPKKARQSILYWRKSAFDPDRLFDWLEPRVRFVWTRAFFAVSTVFIAAAMAVSWQNRDELVSRFTQVFEWETWALAWLTLALVTTCHEFAHGLTCKHYGGEVHEVGFLMMFFMPCFYCNVSDAWLFRERSKRLWVTLAGAHCDLLCWAAAIFVWRVTLQDGLLNYLAWVVLTVCGLRIFFNFNPLLKLDGYYFLSDLVNIPNLRQEANDSVVHRLRWLLWGAARPRRGERRTWFLVGLGLLTWLYGFFFLGLMSVALFYYGHAKLGIVGAAASAALGLYVMKGQFNGLSGGEVRTMFTKRTTRTLVWLSIVIVFLTGVLVVPVERHASGSFELRPRRRVELRAPVAGFLRAVRFNEGEPVPRDAVVAVLDVPDLGSRIAQKRTELAEADAKLRLLKAGPRYEEIAEQRGRVDRARRWLERAEEDLGRARKALDADVAHCDAMIRQHEVELKYATESFERAKGMLASQALSQQEYRDWQRRRDVADSMLQQQRSLKEGRIALGTSLAEGEVAKRVKELAEAKSELALIELCARPEDVAAGEAVVSRVQEELTYLEGLRERLEVRSGLDGGVVVTPRVTESVGQYLKEGDLICTIEECESLEAEVTLKEQELVHVEQGQGVELKARGVPYRVFRSDVSRIAPRATKGDVQSNVALYCRVQDPGRQLKPGMTGHARVICGKQPLARVVCDRVLRSVRTEFWW